MSELTAALISAHVLVQMHVALLATVGAIAGELPRLHAERCTDGDLPSSC